LFPCYLYLLFYATTGHRIRRWSLVKQRNLKAVHSHKL
jgi:hypothetical protein